MNVGSWNRLSVRLSVSSWQINWRRQKENKITFQFAFYSFGTSPFLTWFFTRRVRIWLNVWQDAEMASKKLSFSFCLESLSIWTKSALFGLACDSRARTLCFLTLKCTCQTIFQVWMAASCHFDNFCHTQLVHVCQTYEWSQITRTIFFLFSSSV